MLNENTLNAMAAALERQLKVLGERGAPVTAAEIVGLESTQNALALVHALQSGDTIASLWSVDDVYSLVTDADGEVVEGAVSAPEAREVLRLADKEHDANVGINWDVLDTWLDYVREHSDD